MKIQRYSALTAFCKLYFVIGSLFLILNNVVVYAAIAADSKDICEFKMNQKILLWDNDGTVTGSKDPNDPSAQAKVILPGVEDTMNKAQFNFIISGFKSPESEAQNFDPDKVAAKFIGLMEKLPIYAAAFSPNIGGVACYVVIKRPDTVVIKKAHEDPRYQAYIGQFKKPGIGMFVVIRDIAKEEFGQIIDHESSVMIGDTWHDEMAAKSFGISYIEAKMIHQSSK